MATTPIPQFPYGALHGLQIHLTSGHKWFFPWGHLINIKCENAAHLTILFSSRELIFTGRNLDKLYAELASATPPAVITQKPDRGDQTSGGWQVAEIKIAEREEPAE